MTNRAADRAMIVAQYTDCRAFRSLGVVRITCELPVEYEAEVHRLIGYPQKGVIISVASEEAVKAFADQLKRPAHVNPVNTSPERVNETGKSEHGKRRKEQTPSQHCATWCKNAEFQAWLKERYAALWEADTALSDVVSADDTANNVVLATLGIERKRDLDAAPAKAEEWDRLLTSFKYRDRL